LLEYEANVNARNAADVTALMVAALNGHAETVALLLENDAEVDAVDTGGDFALGYAAGNGHGDVARLLLEHGADVNRKNKMDVSAVQMAEEYGHTDVVALLSDAGAHSSRESAGIAEEAARRAGVNLPAMLLTLTDLPEGAVVESEGFSEITDGIAEYSRQFEAEGLVLQLDSSRAMYIHASVGLYARAADAAREIVKAKQQIEREGGPAELRAMLGEEGLDSVAVEPVELTVGSTSAGWFVKWVTAVMDFDMYVVTFARGRIAAALMFMGPAGRVALADAVSLARLMDERTQREIPDDPDEGLSDEFVAAVIALTEGEQLVREGRVAAAVAAYAEAQALDSTLSIPASSWNTLCWHGSIWNQAETVLDACERAVELAPTAGWIRDSRGVARALTGDAKGAIADFEAFVAETTSEEQRTQRQGWIDALRAGRNPLTPDLLESLRGEAGVLSGGAVEEPPQRLSCPRPSYPDSLRKAGVGGTARSGAGRWCSVGW
jgi:hypothetical protein